MRTVTDATVSGWSWSLIPPTFAPPAPLFPAPVFGAGRVLGAAWKPQWAVVIHSIGGFEYMDMYIYIYIYRYTHTHTCVDCVFLVKRRIHVYIIGYYRLTDSLWYIPIIIIHHGNVLPLAISGSPDPEPSGPGVAFDPVPGSTSSVLEVASGQHFA